LTQVDFSPSLGVPLSKRFKRSGSEAESLRRGKCFPVAPERTSDLGALASRCRSPCQNCTDLHMDPFLPTRGRHLASVQLGRNGRIARTAHSLHGADHRQHIGCKPLRARLASPAAGTFASILPDGTDPSPFPENQHTLGATSRAQTKSSTLVPVPLVFHRRSEATRSPASLAVARTLPAIVSSGYPARDNKRRNGLFLVGGGAARA